MALKSEPEGLVALTESQLLLAHQVLAAASSPEFDPKQSKELAAKFKRHLKVLRWFNGVNGPTVPSTK